jgi:ATP-binding cassette subfamily F protein uup
MRRQPKARGTKQKARIQSFYETKEIAHRKTDQSVVQLDMKMNRLGGKVVELHQIHHQFGEQQVITDFSYVFKPGERIGIVGQNGSGKSTFLNVLTGKLTPTSGTVIHGETLKIGYYSQDGMVLKEDKRVVEVVKDIAEVVELSKGEVITASQLCKRFLFDDKTQYTYVNKLSGGEKRRLFLLTVLIQNPNFLILDEPTNDLDIDTLNVLEEFLEQYKGCLLVVTHDRYFMDKLAEHLFVFDGKGNIRDFNGNYQDYLNEVQEIKDQEKNLKSAKPNDTKTFTNEATVAKKKLSFKEAKELETLSSEIAALEQEKAELNKKLNSGSASHDELLKWSQRVEEIQDLLEEKELRWLELDERN